MKAGLTAASIMVNLAVVIIKLRVWFKWHNFCTKRQLAQKLRITCTLFTEDPCRPPERGGCEHGCVFTHVSFYCTCPDGYQLTDDKKHCEGLNTICLVVFVNHVKISANFCLACGSCCFLRSCDGKTMVIIFAALDSAIAI